MQGGDGSDGEKRGCAVVFWDSRPTGLAGLEDTYTCGERRGCTRKRNPRKWLLDLLCLRGRLARRGCPTAVGVSSRPLRPVCESERHTQRESKCLGIAIGRERYKRERDRKKERKREEKRESEKESEKESEIKKETEK